MKYLKKLLLYFHRNEIQIYFILLLCIVFTFSFSRYVLRMWEIILVSLFILNGGFRSKFRRLKHNYPLLVLASFFFLFVIGTTYTNYPQEGLKYLRIVLPWLGLPIVIGAYPKLSSRQFLLFLKVFIAGVIIHTIISMLAYMGLPFGEVETFRDLGLYYSIHRFVLMIVLAIIFLVYLLKISWEQLKPWKIAVYVLVGLWLTGFLFFTKSLTGILVFILLFVSYTFYIVLVHRNLYLRIGSLVVFILLSGLIVSKAYELYSYFWKIPEPSEMNLPEKTVNGNPYSHNTNEIAVENGHYVHLYVCGKELKHEWEERSDFDYHEKSRIYRKIYNVLKRYLTSKGLTKDSVGVSKLSKSDIEAIENGIFNYKFKSFDFMDRVYRVTNKFYEYQHYKKPIGTFTARIFAMETGGKLIKKRPFAGYGTKSLRPVYEDYYSENDLEGRYYIVSHNQFLSYLVEFGFLGLVWFLVSIFYPFFYLRAYKLFLFNGLVAYYILAAQMTTPFSSQLALTILITFFSVFFVYYTPSQPKKVHSNNL